MILFSVLSSTSGRVSFASGVKSARQQFKMLFFHLFFCGRIDGLDSNLIVFFFSCRIVSILSSDSKFLFSRSAFQNYTKAICVCSSFEWQAFYFQFHFLHALQTFNLFPTDRHAGKKKRNRKSLIYFEKSLIYFGNSRRKHYSNEK